MTNDEATSGRLGGQTDERSDARREKPVDTVTPDTMISACARTFSLKQFFQNSNNLLHDSYETTDDRSRCFYLNEQFQWTFEIVSQSLLN